VLRAPFANTHYQLPLIGISYNQLALHQKGRHRQVLDMDTAGAMVLKTPVLEAERALNLESRRLHYLSVPPAALSAVRLLGEAV
jgi:hypothetical protein